MTSEPLGSINIYVYFQDSVNHIRHLVWSENTQWGEASDYDQMKSLKGLSGTSIACAAEPSYTENRWLFFQSAELAVAELAVQHFRYNSGYNKAWSRGTLKPRCPLDMLGRRLADTD